MIPITESTAVHEALNFTISKTRTLSNYLTAKAAEASAYSTWQTSKLQSDYLTWLAASETTFLSLTAMGAGE